MMHGTKLAVNRQRCDSDDDSETLTFSLSVTERVRYQPYTVTLMSQRKGLEPPKLDFKPLY